MSVLMLDPTWDQLFRLEGLTGSEGLSQLFRFELQLRPRQGVPKLAELAGGLQGKPIHFGLRLAGGRIRP
jgi:hypothetical protein